MQHASCPVTGRLPVPRAVRPRGRPRRARVHGQDRRRSAGHIVWARRGHGGGCWGGGPSEASGPHRHPDWGWSSARGDA